MSLRNQASRLALAVGVTVAFGAPAYASGFYLQEQSTRGLGRAYSGETADTGVQSVWWNPAAIARSEREVYLGAHGILVESEVRDAGSTITRPVPPAGLTTPVGGEPTAYAPILNGLVPNFAAAMPVSDRITLGLSVAAPYNFTTKYSNRSWARYDALKSRLNTGDVQATVGMRATDWLDLGVGVSAQYADARLQTAYPNLSPALPDGLSELSGDGWDFGWTAGAQLHFDRLSIGASYRSEIEHKLKGNIAVSGLLGPLAGSNFAGEGEATFTTPWMATIGARFRATDRLTLNAQYQRMGWSEFDAIEVTTPRAPQTLRQDYEDSNTAAVGADYVVNDRVTVRAGVQWDETPTPEFGRTARVPDGDRWLFAAGTSIDLRENITFDASAGYLAFEDSTVNNDAVFYEGTPAQTTARLRGDVSGHAVILSTGVRWRF